MLKGEPHGESKKRPLGRPYIQGVFKKSSSPVQTAETILNNLHCRELRIFCFMICTI